MPFSKIILRYESSSIVDEITGTTSFHGGIDKFGNQLMDSQLGFRHSQVIDSMLWHNEILLENNVTPDELFWHYWGMEVMRTGVDDRPHIIPAAVQYNPYDWVDYDHTGNKVANKKSIFEMLNPTFLTSLQKNTAILLLDQSVEGYSNTRLWGWFHAKCTEYKINPSAIIYLTGDQSSEDTYQNWCEKNTPSSQMKVIASISLSMYVKKHYDLMKINPKFDNILQYKTENKESLYLYDCLNMRPRISRIIFFLHLLNSGLLKSGNVSMAHTDSWKPYFDLTNTKFLIDNNLPTDIVSKLHTHPTPVLANYNFNKPIDHYYNYVERILDDLYKNSWISIVTESSYFDFESSVFIIEKTFKPIAAMQPFIVLGAKHTLKYLRKLGYRTFHPVIDETYDELNDTRRFSEILNVIKQIQNIEDKPKWYASMREILEHNHKLFIEIGGTKSREHDLICKHYFDYFKGKNV